MSAASYFTDKTHLPPSSAGIELKHGGQYHQIPSPGLSVDDDLKRAWQEDEQLKRRIRQLRFISRFLALLLAIGVLIPISMTLHKFITTKDILREVLQPDGTTVTRNAWALNSKTWPTYMYFAIAVLSVAFNLCTILAYLKGVRFANLAATIEATFSTLVLVSQVVLYLVAVVLYRQQKRTDDLWGWTCSGVARALQKEFTGIVQFDSYCTIQSTSWYFGLAQTGAAILTAVILFLATRRKKTIKKSKRASQMVRGNPEAYEPARYTSA